jgi:hypothetical protein
LEGARRRSRVAARERAQSLSIARLWKWVRGRRGSLTTGAFVGAFAWALGKLGASWIRCNNWRRIGREVCRLPSSRITTLLGLLAGTLALANLRTLAEFAEAVEEDAARGVAELLGVTVGSRDRFTVE